METIGWFLYDRELRHLQKISITDIWQGPKNNSVFNVSLQRFKLKNQSSLQEYFLKNWSGKEEAKNTRTRKRVGFNQLLPFMHYPFSTYTKFSEKLSFLTSWYAHECVRIRGVRNVSFPENLAYVLNRSSIMQHKRCSMNTTIDFFM